MKYIHPKRWYRKIRKTISNYWYNYILPDKVYLKYRYKKVSGEKLNLKNPQTINAKMQWLKLYDRNPEYHKMVDKYEAKFFIENIVGSDYIIPNFGVWDKFEEIEFDKLPNQFVLKCTHDSGSVVICTDKNNFDYVAAKKKISTALKQDYYHYQNRQWVYKDIKPRVIAEKYLSSSTGTKMEYQIFCNNGNPLFFLVRNDLGNTIDEGETFAISYTLDWKRVAYRIGEEKTMHIEVKKPVNYSKMIEIATSLSANIPHVRVDFYEVDNKLFLGELTLCTNGGFFVNYNQVALDILNDTLILPEKK